MIAGELNQRSVQSSQLWCRHRGKDDTCSRARLLCRNTWMPENSRFGFSPQQGRQFQSCRVR
ncbi:hypothetical protein HYC85_020949 [Camellia sinensis]|uniref:Uncharacterized protein n=1 Tax=Camellia sinensis TaxID=4442 RepID=A0A7J7GS90_CAMSI|nr:hypothetical protein HYC85_020949 [Camellia sinensis]